MVSLKKSRTHDFEYEKEARKIYLPRELFLKIIIIEKGRRLFSLL